MVYTKLITGNCVEVLPSIDDNSVHLTVTSPPYDNLRSYKGNIKKWCRSVWEKLIKELYRVTVQGGVVVWVVSDATINGSESCSSFKQALYFRKVGFNLHDTMIYQKDNPVPVGGNNRYFQSFEYMFVFSKGKPRVFNAIYRERKNKWNDKRTERVKAFNRDKDGKFHKKRVSLTGKVKEYNIWNYTVGGGNSVDYGVKHPAAFPEKLVYDHIISWSNENDIILDPMVGSGTTGKVAKILNRNFIGIDLDPEYIEESQRRIDNVNLF